MSDERLQDAIDLRALLRDATPADIQMVNDAIALITERGYDRGRDLATLLRQFTHQT